MRIWQAGKGRLAGHGKPLFSGPISRGWFPFRPSVTSMTVTLDLPCTIFDLLSLR